MFTLKSQTNRASERIAPYCRARRTDEAGFTLLETAIALVLMSIVGLGVASVFVYASKYNVSAADRELSMAVAQQTLEQLRNVAFTDTALAATPTAGTATNVIRGGREYDITTTIVDSNVVNGLATTKRITIKVVPRNDSASWATSVQSVFGSVTLITDRTSMTLGPNRAF